MLHFFFNLLVDIINILPSYCIIRKAKVLKIESSTKKINPADLLGKSTIGNSNPDMTSSAGLVPGVVQSAGSVCAPPAYTACPIANSASTQGQQPVAKTQVIKS